MKIRRTSQRPQVGTGSLDGFDMYLLNLVEDELSLSQLVEIAPREPMESLRHVLHLAAQGLLQLTFETSDERLFVQLCQGNASAALDTATTLRPPTRNKPEARTARAPQSVTQPLDRFDEPTTGIRIRPSALVDNVRELSVRRG